MTAVKMIEGTHLTAGDKRNIAAIVARGWVYGETKQKKYRLEAIDGGLTRVAITERDTDMHGRKFDRVWNYVVQVAA
jgi:hypothetical protein